MKREVAIHVEVHMGQRKDRGWQAHIPALNGALEGKDAPELLGLIAKTLAENSHPERYWLHASVRGYPRLEKPIDVR